jgi:hypothetical protein
MRHLRSSSTRLPRHKSMPSLTPSATFKKDSIDSDSTSSDAESECKITDKLNILCFHANTAKKASVSWLLTTRRWATTMMATTLALRYSVLLTSLLLR